MAITSKILPAKCCCCSLRAGTIVVGTFSMIVALIFLGLFSAMCNGIKNISCSYDYDTDGGRLVCVLQPEVFELVANLLALLAILNGVEIVMSVGLIWGASKTVLSWVTAWLITSACWILLHSAVAIAYLFAARIPGVIILVSILGIFVFGMALLSMLTVFSFRKEMKSSLLSPTCYSSPTANVAGQQAEWSGQTQPIM